MQNETTVALEITDIGDAEGSSPRVTNVFFRGPARPMRLDDLTAAVRQIEGHNNGSVVEHIPATGAGYYAVLDAQPAAVVGQRVEIPHSSPKHIADEEAERAYSAGVATHARFATATAETTDETWPGPNHAVFCDAAWSDYSSGTTLSPAGRAELESYFRAGFSAKDGLYLLGDALPKPMPDSALAQRSLSEAGMALAQQVIAATVADGRAIRREQAISYVFHHAPLSASEMEHAVSQLVQLEREQAKAAARRFDEFHDWDPDSQAQRDALYCHLLRGEGTQPIH